MESEQLIRAFSEFTGLFTPVWFWKLDAMFNVLHSDCPHEALFHSAFLRDGRREAVEAHMASSHKPVCFTVSSLLSWVMAFAVEDGRVQAIHLVGPFFVGRNDPESFREYLLPMKLSAEAEATLWEALKELPVISTASISRMAVILHYCVRHEKLPLSDVSYYVTRPRHQKLRRRVDADQFEKSSGRWAMEQELLERVRRGDLSAPELLTNADARFMIQAFGSGRSVQSMRLNIHQLLTLVSRAAVDGGLPQRTAFSLATEYRGRLERCTSTAELELVSHEMLRDYVSRVHNMKRYAKCSPQIRLCCEYIDTHPEEKLNLEALARKAGYSSFHLSRKFRQEMGCSVIEYIQRSKLERARYMLTHTDTSVDDISAELGFNSRNYFTSVFKQHTGMTPTQYRRGNSSV